MYAFRISTLAIAAIGLTILGVVSCQRAGVAPPPDAYLASVSNPRTVIVKGRVYYGKNGRDTTLMRDFRTVFSHQLNGGITETVTDNTMPRTGYYRIRLRVGYTYEAALMVGDCRVETIEWKASDKLHDSVSIQNFYLDYPDSTEYGGCLSGWHPRAVKP
jgi:hypothetical protein